MAELRWLLLLFGVCVVVAVYVYTRFKPSIAKRMQAVSLRKEPSIGDSTPEIPIAGPDPVVVQTSISPQPRKVVAIRLMSRKTAGFEGEQLILTLRELGLRHGQFGIFHCMDESGEGGSVFSVASLVEPGSFDLTRIKTDTYPGVSIFLALPGPQQGVSAFDEMLKMARELAARLDGDLLDEQGGTLSVQRERYMREEIIQFEHQEME